MGPQGPLLATVKRQKLAWFGPVAHTPQQPPQNHLSGQLGGWAMPWLAEEMLEGYHQTAQIPALARAAHKGL